jgi:hypothetical protein
VLATQRTTNAQAIDHVAGATKLSDLHPLSDEAGQLGHHVV